MRSEIANEALFTLEEHERLWAKGVYPWEILQQLAAYLEEIFAENPLGKIEGVVASGAYLLTPEKLLVGKGTVIEAGAYIEGPCVIGENCLIRHGAYIRGPVLIGHHCVVGHATEVKHSVLLNQVQAAHFNYVGDSILGKGVHLGAGVKCANLRLDEKEIVIRYQGALIPTLLKKLGAFLGDGCQLGCNSVTSPGTIMGKGALCYPCIQVGGIIPSHALVKSSSTLPIKEER